MIAKVFHTGAHLAVQTTYHFKDVCKGIPGAKWKPDLKAWIYPATPHAARAIHQTFANQQAVWSEDAATLLLEAETIAEAHSLKSADALPDIPVSKTQAWTHQKRAFWFAVELLGGLPNVRR